MGFFEKLFGGREAKPPPAAQRPVSVSPQSADERDIAQYRYMLRTAPPEAIEQAHAEAFAKLSPEQRSLLLQQLTADLPASERPAAGAAATGDSRSLARMATRAEVRQPGTMERTFGGMGGRGMGMGGMMAGSFLSTIAGVVVGSAIAQSFLGRSDAADTAAADGQTAADASAHETTGDAGGDMGDTGDMDGGNFG